MAGPYRRVRATANATVEDRLRLHMVEAPSGCWIWIGARDGAGYGCVTVNGRTTRAHRTAWLEWVGPIPDGMHLDHLCRRPACIKPLHLQVVTPQTNMLRGTSPGARAVRGEACRRGHPRAEYGYANSSRVFCRECQRLWRVARKAAMSEAVAS